MLSFNRVSGWSYGRTRQVLEDRQFPHYVSQSCHLTTTVRSGNGSTIFLRCRRRQKHTRKAHKDKIDREGRVNTVSLRLGTLYYVHVAQRTKTRTVCSYTLFFLFHIRFVKKCPCLSTCIWVHLSTWMDACESNCELKHAFHLPSLTYPE